ncbi:Druantia anti-phage system protein DruA [Paenibacillus cymbidii]|uniref:Druantia anti-phage system protein DruA n=1 Tax=Paenibacillus cymbidii TaxID=1639034 RepID=UPI001A9A9D33
METFVEKDRFTGTCYKAANWVRVGVTKGRGKLDQFNQYALPVKDIYLYPLHKQFRQRLNQPT